MACGILVPQPGIEGFPDGSESAFKAGDLGSIPGLGRSPGKWNSYPLQYYGLENSMNYIVHGVAKSQTRLSDFHFTPRIEPALPALEGQRLNH